MTSFTQAIEKLIRRIKRAFSKGKSKKVDRLTNELNDLLKQQEHVDENTVVGGNSPPSSSESSEEDWSVEENLSENDSQVIGDVTYEEASSEEESLPSGNGDAPENEGGEDASSNIEEGIIDDELTEEDYLAGKTDGNEFRY